jgi:hypothetical protein
MPRLVEPTRSYLYCALTSTLNIVLYALTLGRFLWLEGRVRGGVFRNWLRRARFRPSQFARPTSEAEIVELVRRSTGVRVFGAGHSFNHGVVADHTLVSLDNYQGILWRDSVTKRVAFGGGTRVRDASRLLRDLGLAFENLPSHDAQSLAGIISTDVHGTGRDWGFVSEMVTGITLVDGTGAVHKCAPTDDLYRTAIGGIGAAGIISEVVVQAVDRFNVEQKTEISDFAFVRVNLDRLLRDNVHLSLYLFPFTDTCQINTWNPTTRRRSPLGRLREFVNYALDALLAAWVANLICYTGLLPRVSPRAHRLKRNTRLVLDSFEAFHRTLYHLHQELEFAVPFEQTFDVCDRFVKLYERLYREAPLPYTLFEVRFTPAGHDRTLIGPGRDRRSMWLDLLTNDSHGFERYFAAAEALLREMEARPHPGKFNETFGPADLERLHGEQFRRFRDVVRRHDPERKFANDFTQRLLGKG